ncbi:histidine--tRNA ligase [Flavihumibacter solisilvae]|uniref:Histidine--tRNA ligase n=1 Tax=Flavihumibacter solisilvae TaxID=1349421 RepID=A0A0C1LIZ1_9BACT|nr:histidine--tRNA ligase [Flavihumibacter solisilvae]KIC95363.1 histidyl-tRNA synthase [Flavihumibacter solisilvae]
MKPSLPSGTRDFGPEVVRKRNYIFTTIREVFELYGFQPLETPALENLETLMGKYGEEGDKLIFKILNNGLNDPKNIDKARSAFEQVMTGRNDKNLTERALRYDLTIPFARYVAMNHGQLSLPFKRYQIQPVWRADRPQKGRYREFYQCDADVVGSYSLLNEVELTSIYANVFKRLGVPVEIRINNRKVLAALAELCGGSDKMMDITIAIDKLDKIGIEKVKEELAQRGLQADQVAAIENYLAINGDNQQKFAAASDLLGHLEIAQKGLAELKYMLDMYEGSEVVIDFTLARGLNYYTGVIYEIKAIGVQMGSIGGGGRYDDLTGLFGVPNIPGVGISFGVDRIYDVMEELKLFPSTVRTGTQVLFFNLGERESLVAYRLVQDLRKHGVACELYHEPTKKFDKQFKYAEKKDIPYVVIIGSQELEAETCIIKDLRQGNQITLPQSGLVGFNFDTAVSEQIDK